MLFPSSYLPLVHRLLVLLDDLPEHVHASPHLVPGVLVAAQPGRQSARQGVAEPQLGLAPLDAKGAVLEEEEEETDAEKSMNARDFFCRGLNLRVRL